MLKAKALNIMKHLRQLPSLLSKVVSGAHFEWQTTVKGGRALGAALLRVLHLREGGLTFFWYKAVFGYAKFVVRLQRRSGWRYVVIYLKACAVLLQQSVGAHKIDNTRDLNAAVSRTGAGLPRIIPIQHRRSLMSGDIWTFRIWLTLLGLYRVIEFPGTLKLHTVTAPSTLKEGFLREWYGFLVSFWPVAVRMWRRNAEAGKLRSLSANHVLYGSKPERVTPSLPVVTVGESLFDFAERLAAHVSRGGENPSQLNLKPRLLAILKGSPNTGGIRTPFFARGKEASSTSIGAIFSDVRMWLEYPAQTVLPGQVPLYPFLKEWLALVKDTVVTRLFFLGDKVIAQVDPQSRDPRATPNTRGGAMSFPGFGRAQGLGKLGFKCEPAGKIRVFAMVDCVTQIIMKPFHSQLFNILGTIPQDGTFNQLAPAHRLRDRIGPRGSYWSYDLSAATDRFPVMLQHAVVALLLGPRLAGLWVRLLTWREFAVPRLPEGVSPPAGGLPSAVVYGAGQPQGALTSWAAFSLTHHLLVQYAAYKAYRRLEWFELYALLGDDIVLADGKVAREYLTLLQEIGVEVGLAKSLISTNGCFEFAKRTFIHGTDASWISLTAVGAAKADHSVLEAILGVRKDLLGWGNVLATVRVAAKFLDYGYRRLASLPAVLDTRSRLQGLTVLLTRPGSAWSSSVKDWLFQVRPGEVGEVPDGVHEVICARLWERLVDGLNASVRAHLDGFERVRLPDEYGTGARVMDPGNWHRNAWEYFILGNLLQDLRSELDRLVRDAQQLKAPTVQDLTQIWSSVMELREALDAIPVTPNLVDRAAERFEGRKRSHLIRMWRALRASSKKALRNLEGNDV